MTEEQVKDLIGDLNCEVVNRYIHRKCKEHEKWWMASVKLKIAILHSIYITIITLLLTIIILK